jgi:hypothetical protein
MRFRKLVARGFVSMHCMGRGERLSLTHIPRCSLSDMDTETA